MSASEEAVTATGDERPQFFYSRGRDTFDNYPEQRSAATLREFVHQTISDRQQRKGQGFICGPAIATVVGAPREQCLVIGCQPIWTA